MSNIAIKVEGLGKRYRLGEGGGAKYRYKSLRDSLAGVLSRSPTSSQQPTNDSIWALKDVSFEIKQGEVVGIIGRNGAGKSTLLKLLSRITEPTEGTADIFGRVGSLLEVGTGFHPELTGRENIYLNGAILGMRRTEIRSRFDEIIAFAEVEKFIDTPVKHYSSGMQMRLAFAVAAHLEPQILLVDEVLAVGDIEFQKKCVGKVESVARQGRTALMVSHSMATIRALCSRALVVDCGQISFDGEPADAIDQYVGSTTADPACLSICDTRYLTTTGSLRVRWLRLENAVDDGFRVRWLDPISVLVSFEVNRPLREVSFGAGLRALDGTHIVTVHHDDDGSHPLWTLQPGEYRLRFRIHNQLRPGFYVLHLGADCGHTSALNLFQLDAVTLEVLDYSSDGSVPLQNNTGLVVGSSTWEAPETHAGGG